MAGTHPYPSIEHYDFPESPTEVLLEEVAIYKTGPELRVSATGMSRIYQRFPFTEALQKYAYMAALVKTGQRVKEIDDGFYSGEIMGLHSLYRGLPVHARKQLILQDPWYRMVTPDMPNDETFDDHLNRANMAHLHNFMENGWQAHLGAHKPAFQWALNNLTHTMFKGEPNAAERQQQYTVGYLYAADIVINAVST